MERELILPSVHDRLMENYSRLQPAYTTIERGEDGD